jgi:hypothetical protein
MSILPSPLLRQALLSDAVTSIACALLMFLGAGLLHTMLGLSVSLLRSAGLILFLYAGLVAWLGMRTTLRRLAVLAVIVGNAIWAVDSLLLLASGWVEPTRAGYAFVLAQALVVAMYAQLQWMGLRRSEAVPA